MTETLVERVARAIFDAQFGFAAKNAWADYSPHRGEWGTAEQHQRDWSFKTARAAIAAMREPTEAMVAEAMSRDEEGSSLFGDPFVACSHEEAYRAMIDAALKEP